MLHLLVFVLLHLTIGTVQSATCPITQVNQYKYGCNLSGTIKKPVLISKQYVKGGELGCAELCLDDLKCHSFRYVQHSGNDEACYLYELHLENMGFVNTPKRIGIYQNTYCFSKDCDEIGACTAINDCNSFDSIGASIHYQYFGCGYGITSTFDASSTIMKLFPGRLTACKAAKDCAKQLEDGPFEVHYDISSQQWACFAVKNLTPPGNFTLKEEGISYQTFTVKNASVAASYGFWETCSTGRHRFCPPRHDIEN